MANRRCQIIFVFLVGSKLLLQADTVSASRAFYESGAQPLRQAGACRDWNRVLRGGSTTSKVPDPSTSRSKAFFRRRLPLFFRPTNSSRDNEAVTRENAKAKAPPKRQSDSRRNSKRNSTAAESKVESCKLERNESATHARKASSDNSTKSVSPFLGPFQFWKLKRHVSNSTDASTTMAKEKSETEERTKILDRENETISSAESLEESKRTEMGGLESSEKSNNETEAYATSNETMITTTTSGLNDTAKQSPPTIILFGAQNQPPSSDFRYNYRYQQRGSPPVPPPPPGTVPPGQVSPYRPPDSLSPNGIIAIEIVASLLRSLTRLWLVTWVARRLAQQEESFTPTQHFVWERLNDKFIRDVSALQTTLKEPPYGVSAASWRRNHVRKVLARQSKEPVDWTQTFTRTVVVVELNTSNKDGPDVEYLSDIITFLLQQYEKNAFGKSKETQLPLELEVVFLVQSPGGSVASFGLAAAQIKRLSGAKGIVTTVCVDKYAASGGYMIASQANKLIAAPFATIGSVGVIMEGLNFHDLARKCGIYPLVVKAGNSKNPFTTFGQVTQENLAEEQRRLEKVHDAFKNLIVEGRPVLNDKLPQVADGSVYLGGEAQHLGLVDDVMTSSEYILQRIQAGDRVLKLHRTNPARFARRVSISPLDILPHLQAWWRSSSHSIVSMIRGMDFESAETVEKIVQVGSLLGFLHHIVSRHFASKEGTFDFGP